MSYPDTPEKQRITEFYQNIGKAVYDIRKSRNLTQEEFGEMFGISRVAVNCIEQGKQRLSVYHYAVICNEFGVDLVNFSIDSLPEVPVRTKLQKAIDSYKQSVFSSGLTAEQKTGAELVFIGLESIIKPS